jgi:hypothetical protein
MDSSDEGSGIGTPNRIVRQCSRVAHPPRPVRGRRLRETPAPTWALARWSVWARPDHHVVRTVYLSIDSSLVTNASPSARARMAPRG